MKQCPRCASEITDFDAVCPRCGLPIEENSAKNQIKNKRLAKKEAKKRRKEQEKTRTLSCSGLRMTPKTVHKWGYELVKVHHPASKASRSLLSSSSTYWNFQISLCK